MNMKDPPSSLCYLSSSENILKNSDLCYAGAVLHHLSYQAIWALVVMYSSMTPALQRSVFESLFRPFLPAKKTARIIDIYAL